MKKNCLVIIALTFLISCIGNFALADEFEFDKLTEKEKNHYGVMYYQVPTKGIQTSGRYAVFSGGVKYSMPVSKLKRKKHMARIMAENYRYMNSY